jgi:hypothetical protein
MRTCLRCGASVADGLVCCGNCGARIVSSLPEFIPHRDELYFRLEKAMRRAELLSYAAAGLGVAILFSIIGVAFVG